MPPIASASLRLGTISVSASRWSNNSSETLILFPVAHSSSSARFTRYCPPMCCAGRPRCLIQRETVDSPTLSSRVRSCILSCIRFLNRLMARSHSRTVQLLEKAMGRLGGAAATQLDETALIPANRCNASQNLVKLFTSFQRRKKQEDTLHGAAVGIDGDTLRLKPQDAGEPLGHCRTTMRRSNALGKCGRTAPLSGQNALDDVWLISRPE